MVWIGGRGLRVAVIAPPWVPVPPPAYGGTEAVLDNLVRGLQEAGHEVLLFATGDSTCEVPTRWVLETAAGTTSTGSATELRHVVNAYAAALDWGADIVHDHTLVGPIYAQRHGVPVVTTNHGPFDSELGEYYRAIAGLIPLIAISHHHASRAGEMPIAGVIHHGVDVDTFPLGDGSGGYALFLGRVSPDKGIAPAIRIAQKARVPLKIAAKMREPAEFAYFEQEVGPLLGDDVEFLGEVSMGEKLRLLADAQCLINPLAWPEPFGMVMIESLACGTPVVATPCGSVPELITDGVTGFVRSGEDALAAAVGQVMSLDRSRCRKEAAERFSTERMVSEHVALYQRVLASATA